MLTRAITDRVLAALCVKVNCMPYRMNEKQFALVLALVTFNRYAHFIVKIADWEQLLGVKSDEGCLVTTTE